MKRKILWIVAAGLVLILGVVAFFSFVYRGPEVLTVSAARSQANALQGQALWVKGRVVSGSIVREDLGTRFVLADGLGELRAVYGGTLPDNFSPGIEMEVLGVYKADGTFEIVKFGKPPVFCTICHG